MDSILQTFKTLQEKLLEVDLVGQSVGEFMETCRTITDAAILDLARKRIREIDCTIAGLTFDRGGWLSVKKDVPRTLETILGPFTYERRYYRDRQTKAYCYLTDVIIGVRPYQRVEDQLGIALIEAASRVSYRQASVEGCAGRVSATTIMNSIRQIRVPEPNTLEPKRWVQELHIQADEDHVHLQQQHRKSGQIRFAAIHEPKVKVGSDRYQLPGRHMLCSVNEPPEDFGERVLDALDAMYDMDQVKTIYCHGDGASWIQTMSALLPGSIPILDHFHLEKALLGVCRGDRRLRSRLRKTLHPWDDVVLKTELQMLVDSDVCTKEKAHKLWVYLQNNQQGIVNHFTLPHGGSCAEGLVSHVFSKRFSRDPLAWSIASLRRLSEVRVHLENGNVLDKTMLWKPAMVEEPVVEFCSKVKTKILDSKKPSVPNWSVSIPGSGHISGAIGAIIQSINHGGFHC